MKKRERIKYATGKRCNICDNDLSLQQHNSVICSVEIYGEHAKSCRKALNKINKRIKQARIREEKYQCMYDEVKKQVGTINPEAERILKMFR